MRKQRIRHSGGYMLVHEPDHPKADKFGYVYEHRLVVEEAGIAIPDGYHVHHKNGVKDDNRLENLEVIAPGAHTRHHHLGRPDITDAQVADFIREGRTYRELEAMGIWQRRIVHAKRAFGLPVGEQKTHCKRGHAFTPENTRTRSDGRRDCRVCKRDWARRKRLQLKELAA